MFFDFFSVFIMHYANRVSIKTLLYYSHARPPAVTTARKKKMKLKKILQIFREIDE